MTKRYCSCGAMLDTSGFNVDEARPIIAEWETQHWAYKPITVKGKMKYMPIGSRRGHDYSGGPVIVNIGQKMTTGGGT